MEEYVFKDLKWQNEEIYIRPDEVDISERKRRTYHKIAETQRYYQRNPVRFVNEWFHAQLLDAQALIFQVAWTTPNVLLNCTRGFGKALQLGTGVLTQEFGIIPIEDVQVGDHVYTPDGMVAPVIEKSQVWYDDDCYKITFEDGEEITCNKEHEWSLFHNKEKVKINTEKLFSAWDGKFSVGYTNPIPFEKRELELHPYVLGLFLGNAPWTENKIQVFKKDGEDLYTYLNGLDYVSIRDNGEKRRETFSLSSPEGENMYSSLMKLSVTEKSRFIPDDYLLSSIEDRMELLRGIIDGYNMPSLDGNSIELEFEENIHNLTFVFDFNRLLTFLGVKFEYGIRGDLHCFRIFNNGKGLSHLSRIENSFNKNIPFNNVHKKLLNIEKVKSVPTVCIQVGHPDSLFLCGDGLTPTHNSTIIGILLMAKGMLFNNYWTYIASGTASQAQQTFTTLERIANDNIDTMKGLTGSIFKKELVVSNNGDGFAHNTKGYRYSLYNGSYTQTLSSNIDKNRGNRGSVVFDECGWLSAEMINVYGAYAIVNKSFKTGVSASGQVLNELELYTIPKEIPNQRFFISSASTTDSEFYNLYCDFSKRMFIGDRNYFVAHIDCEVAFHATIGNKELDEPLLSPETVKEAMRTNPERALREYYGLFTTDAGANAILRRGIITRNSVARPPLLENDTGDKKFIISYDPARMSDNSVISIGEVYETNGDLRMRVVNCINLIDIHKKKKTPVIIQKQVEILREIILAYNKGGNSQYSNIYGIYIDGGSGGQANAIVDLLMEDWVDENGEIHYGLVDLDHETNGMIHNPNAVTDKLHVVDPNKYKSEMFDAMIDLIKSDKMEFTAEYENRGYLMMFKEERGESKSIKYDLTNDEQSALANIDLMKDELVNMVRIKRNNGRDGFEIADEKRKAYPHDDHAYTAAMLGYGLKCQRDKNKRPATNSSDLIDLLGSKMKSPKRLRS